MTKAEARRIAERQVIERARELYAAHVKSHGVIKSPDRGFDGRKYAMNYGELNALHDALVTLDSFN